MKFRLFANRNTKKMIPNSDKAKDDVLSMQSDNPEENRNFNNALLLIGLSFFLMLAFFLGAFFLAVRGAERTVVPEITELPLIEALVKLQDRELYPRIQTKYTGNPDDKGLVISQNPEPGLYVKAGRRILVTVSRGAIVDTVENYLGEDIEKVRSRLSTLFTTFEPLLILQEPVIYVYDEAPEGTVLSQTPDPGTPLSEAVELVLIVSRGVQDRSEVLPDWTGQNTGDVLMSLAGMRLAFQFSEDDAEAIGSELRVVSQEPQAGSAVKPGERIFLRYRKPAVIPEGSRYGIFQYTLPEYAVPVLLKVLIQEPDAQEQIFISMPHSGGTISFPYILPVASSISLMLSGVEEHRYTILAENQ